MHSHLSMGVCKAIHSRMLQRLVLVLQEEREINCNESQPEQSALESMQKMIMPSQG